MHHSGYMLPMRATRRWHECHLHQLQRVSYPHQPSHRQAKGPSELSPDNGPSRMMAKIVPIISPRADTNPDTWTGRRQNSLHGWPIQATERAHHPRQEDSA